MLLSCVEKMMNLNSSESFQDGQSRTSALNSLILAVVWLVLILLLAKYLWNNTLVNLFTTVKPCKDVFHLLGLAVMIDLFLCK